MDVFKTYLFFSDYDQGSPYLIDTILHEGRWWLVGSWLEQIATGERIPERLVLLDGQRIRYQEVQGEPYRFVLSNSLPRGVLAGTEQDGYVVATYQALARTQGPDKRH